MTSQGDRLDSVGDAAAFVAALRELRQRSGLTLRGLEEKAAAQGEVLARSTVADMLRKDSLPRPELLAAYVRACGVDEPEPWLRARERLAAGVVAPAAGTSPGPAPWQRPSLVLTAVVVAALVATAVVLQRDAPTASDPAADRRTSGPGRDLLPLPPGGSQVRVHAADAPGLCLTEGRDSTGRYPHAVAALRPCPETGPRVFLDPVDDGTAAIQWEHPVDRDIGCLTVMRSGPAADLLEPRSHCAGDDLDQLFQVERVEGDRFRFRSADGSACVGLRGGAVAEGAEAVREPCADSPGQEFTVELLPTGR
ncbi:helix-turn-helix protein [Saccharothrix saharensis]|uniref:Helix-turn-helix protein n=1 Tax=Saccharothrix saharensis TaxID=571190 RepID=A0A543JMF3_9PSEU|nr:helix-turn-helix transcriptional regulator [Saccharothrix saharensis]TQM84037.1 helix-turn-helix protein [Saccharothrix saharensis]